MKVLTGQRQAFLLTALVAGAMFFAFPCVSCAPFGGLANMANGKAVAATPEQPEYATNPAWQALPMHERPKLAVYVSGSEDPALNKAMVSRLITALSNSGRYQAADNYKEFFESAVEEQGKDSASSMKKEQIKALGEQFGADYVCVAEITTALGEKQASAHILDVKTAEITATGVADVPLKTSADLTVAAEQIVETMFKNAAPHIYAQKSVVVPAPRPEASTADTPTPAANVTGEAKVVVDKVVVAVNAFKEATKKSMDAADAVKSATQSKNFSAIMDAKKKVQSAAEAVKTAKADVTTAIEALKAAGPEAEAAVKAMGIDLSMFAGKSKEKAKATGAGAGTYKTTTSKQSAVTGGTTCTSAGTCKTVTIGGKTWMAENLNIQTADSWCYGNSGGNCAKYGRLYTWNAAKSACPDGWHLPTIVEWNALMSAVGSPAGTKLKSANGWYSGGNGTDNFGFSALPGGGRYSGGYFDDAGNNGYWWTATEFGSSRAYYRNMYYNDVNVYEYGSDKSNSFSVRCVRDD
jgi:uncharacterized protein (TIGR02145 family)